jgi:hypothetical protein
MQTAVGLTPCHLSIINHPYILRSPWAMGARVQIDMLHAPTPNTSLQLTATRVTSADDDDGDDLAGRMPHVLSTTTTDANAKSRAVDPVHRLAIRTCFYLRQKKKETMLGRSIHGSPRRSCNTAPSSNNQCTQLSLLPV